MVTIQEARETASRRLSDISGFKEFTNAYMFFNPRSENVILGVDMPVFIIKETGERMSTLLYYDIMPGEEVRTVYF